MRIVNETMTPKIPTLALKRALLYLAARGGVKPKDIGTIIVDNRATGSCHVSTKRSGTVHVAYSLMGKAQAKQHPDRETRYYDQLSVKLIDDKAQRARLRCFVENAAYLFAYFSLRMRDKMGDVSQSDWQLRMRYLLGGQDKEQDKHWSKLLDSWLVVPQRTRKAKAKPDPLAGDIARVKASLADWHRKERLASTKIKVQSRKLLRLVRKMDARAMEADAIRMFEEDTP